MKLTKNQGEVRQGLNDYCDINIIVDVKEKNGMFTSTEDGIYDCDQCGKERKISEPGDGHYTCGECFNCNKLPFITYDLDLYGCDASDAQIEFRNNALGYVKKNTPLKEVKEEYKKSRIETLREYCVDMPGDNNHAGIMEKEFEFDFEKEVIELSKEFHKMFFGIAHGARAMRGHGPVVDFASRDVTSVNIGSFGDDLKEDSGVSMRYPNESKDVVFYRNGEVIEPKIVKEGK